MGQSIKSQKWTPWLYSLGLTVGTYLWVSFGSLGNGFGAGRQETIFYMTDFADGGFFDKKQIVIFEMIMALPVALVAAVVMVLLAHFFLQD